MDNAITRPRLLLGAAALLCLLVVQIAAASGSGDPQATASAGVSKKKFKKLKKRVKALEQQGQQPGPQGPPGEQGEQGEQGERGPRGRDATNLFAYIRDFNEDNPAAVEYGSGVTGVSDPSGSNTYTVAFNRSVVNCVVHGTSGFGDPAGTPRARFPGYPFVDMNVGGSRQIAISFSSNGASFADTSFFITAFC